MMRAICVAATSLPDASPRCIAQFASEDGLYKAKPIFPQYVCILYPLLQSMIFHECSKCCLLADRRAFDRAWKVLLRPSEHITCGDMVFSGHTVFFMLCAMTVKWVRSDSSPSRIASCVAANKAFSSCYLVQYCVRSELDTSFTRRFPYVLWMVRYTVYTGVGLGIFMIVGTRLHYTLDVLIAIYVTTQTWFLYHWLLLNPKKNVFLRVLNWLEHDEVRFIDLDAYRQARRSFRVSKKTVVVVNSKTE